MSSATNSRCRHPGSRRRTRVRTSRRRAPWQRSAGRSQGRPVRWWPISWGAARDAAWRPYAPDVPRHETCRVRSWAMSTETPTNGDGEKLCAWCGGLVPPSRGTKPRAYCKRGCVQRAHEARKLRKKLFNAYTKGRTEEAEAREAKSRDVPNPQGKSRDFARRDDQAKSRDVPKPQVVPEVPAPPPPSDFLLAPPAATPQEPTVPPDAARKAPAPLPPRRRLARRAHRTAEVMPIWRPEEDEPETS